MPMQDFMKKFGPLQGLSHEDIITKVLGNGKCVRHGDDIDSFDLGNEVLSQFFFCVLFSLMLIIG